MGSVVGVGESSAPDFRETNGWRALVMRRVDTGRRAANQRHSHDVNRADSRLSMIWVVNSSRCPSFSHLAHTPVSRKWPFGLHPTRMPFEPVVRVMQIAR